MENKTTTTFVKSQSGDVYKKTVTETYQKVTIENLQAQKQSRLARITGLQAENTQTDSDISKIETLLDE
jgi:hypothetical protein